MGKVTVLAEKRDYGHPYGHWTSVIRFSSLLQNDMKEWGEEHCEGLVLITGQNLYFQVKADAIYFRLAYNK